MVKIYEIALASRDDLDLHRANLTWFDIKDHYLHEKGMVIEPAEASNSTGRKTFVDDVFDRLLANIVVNDSKRRTGSGAIDYPNWGNLTNMRLLRKNVIDHFDAQ